MPRSYLRVLTNLALRNDPRPGLPPWRGPPEQTGQQGRGSCQGWYDPVEIDPPIGIANQPRTPLKDFRLVL